MATQTQTQSAVGSARFSAQPRGYVVDRVVVGLLLLAILIAAALIFLWALGLVQLSALLPGDWGDRLAAALQIPGVPERLGNLATGATAAVVGLLSALLLVRRIVPRGGRRAATQHHILSADERGLVLVDKQGVSKVAEAAVQRTAGVVDVKVQVLGQATSMVRLVVRVWAHAGAELKQVGDEAREQAREAVEQLVGLQVHDVIVRVHVVPLEDLDRVVE